MEAKQKAKRLIEKFKTKTVVIFTEDSVPCVVNADKSYKSAVNDAIICVNELIEECKSFGYWNQGVSDKCVKHYEEVKQELEKLK